MSAPFRIALAALAVLSATHAAARGAGLVLVCGAQLQPAYPSPPAGLPSSSCSRAVSFGGAAGSPGGGGADLDPVHLLKALDANSLVLLERLLRSDSAGTIHLHAFVDGAGGAALEYLRIRIDDARVLALSSGTAASEPVESLSLAGSELRWSVWSPPAPPPTPPTATFCWDLTTQSECNP